MALQEYAKKRDFKKTSEPKGRKVAGKTRSTNLMFVVQEHHASHLHYDFRLEWEGVLKSWAVPKGPSLDPQTKRLAVQVEDHPLEYGKFEGIIEEGNYGAGEVYLWDTGIWEPTIDVAAGLKKGHIDFNLKGKRLKGSWTMIRTRGTSGSKAQWLLFKRSDKFAKEGDVAEEIGSDEEHILNAQKKVWKNGHAQKRTPPREESATKKSAAKSVSKSTRRKPRKSALAFVEPQLAQLVDAPPEGENWIHEIKLDGYRIQAHVNHGDVKLMTRTGLDWTDKFPALIAPLQELDVEDAILDGEVVILDDKGHSNFGHLQNAIKERNAHNMYYYLFDCLHLNGKDLRNKELRERKEALEEMIPSGKSRLRFSEHFDGHGDKLLKEMCRLKLEGIISKRGDSHYVSGRKGTWQKSKCTAEQEFVIGGYTEGTGSRAHMGALLLGVYEGKKLRFVGKCGTGFDVKTLNSVLARLKKLEQDETPFSVKSPRERGIHWVKPVLSAEVTFAQWTNDGHLRIPVFKGLREDKPAKKIVEEVPLIQTETTKSHSKKVISKSAKTALPRKVASNTARTKKNVETAAITSPEKIVFKKEKITKSEINNYYQTVAKWILPEIEDRPLSLVRSPAGTDKYSFFQKHVTGKLAGNLEPIDIKEKTATRQYLTASDKDSLTSLVQMNAYEIHAWNCRRDDIEHPDQIVMDFDPGPGVSWKQVIDAAFDLKEILDVLKLKSFVKLSGGKGIHVHIPLAPKYSWDQIKNFSHILAKQMADQDPDKYTAIISKSKREKKIFVDYLRNGRGSTAVIAYSLRAKPESAVAMPVEWKDLKKYKAANEFTLEKALKHLKARKKDPWKGMAEIKQPILLLEKTPNKRKAA
jgi:DNA ligase D